MGIDSRWVIEHPDWFLARPDSPYPGLLLHRRRPLRRPAGGHPDRGPLLGLDRRRRRLPAGGPLDRRRPLRLPRQRRDQHAVERHGPARLPASRRSARPSSRRSSRVARRFPIIRFDAAMTLAKKHVARLWYPEPGHGGAIPSRAESRDVAGRLRRGDARGVLARGGRPGGRRGPRHAPPGRGLLADGGLLRPDPRHAPGLQQRLHEHAARREERGVPPRRQEHPRVRPGDPQALRQLHEQPRREDRGRAVRDRRQVLRHRDRHGHHAGPPDVRPRPGRGVRREVRDGVPAGLLGRAPERGARRPPRVAALPAPPQAPALRRGPRLPPLRRRGRRRPRQRGRLRLLQPLGRRAVARDLPQPLRIDARPDPGLGRLRREGCGGREAPGAELAGRRARPRHRPGGRRALPRHPRRPGVHPRGRRPPRSRPARGAGGLCSPRPPRLA